MQKKIVSLLLVACMMLAMLPALALPMFAAEETYVTSFGKDSENYPSIEGGAVVMPDAWTVGSIPVTATANGTSFNPIVFGTGFTPFNLVETSGTYGICDTNKNAWGSNNGMGGGFGIGNGGNSYKNTLLMGVNYSTESDANTRTVKSVVALPAVRYIAEYSGTVSIGFDIGYYFPNGTYLTILKNGAVYETFQTGVSTGVIADIAVTMGDTIDFVSTPDLDYDYDSCVAAGYSSFNYGYGKRGLVINELEVAYAAGYYVPDIGMGEMNAELVENFKINAPERYFFAWFKADGTRVTPVSDILVDGCYGVVNPYLIENGIVAEDDTYKAAMEKYRVWVKSTIKVEYNGNWSVGENWAGEYGAYLYPASFGEKNAYMIRSSGKGPIITEFATNRLVSERQFDKIFDSCYEAGFKGTAASNPTIPTPTTKVSDIKVSYNTNLFPSGNQGDGKAWAPTSVGAAGGVEGKWYDNAANAFYARPGSNSTNVNNMQAGVVAWTAPATGIVNFDALAVNFASSNVNPVTTTNLDTNMAIFINGEQKTAWTTVSNKNGENPADTVDAMLAGLGEIVVYAGDTVEFTFVRGASGGTHVNMSIEAFLDTSRLPVVYKSGDTVLAQFIGKKGDALPVLEGFGSFGSSGYMVNGVYTTELPLTVEEGLLIEDFSIDTAASIAIAGDFYVNVYVDGGETVTAAGLIVNGIVMPGEKQANGSYKVVVTAVNAADLLDTTIKYFAYQYHEDGSYRLSKVATTVNTGDMLDEYVDGETDTATKEMADAIRDYAYMANLYFTNGTLEANASIKNELKGPFTILNGQNGSNHTNYDSGLYDVMLATLKKYSVEGYVPAYTNQNYKDPVTGQLDTFVDAPNIFPANKVEWGFGDQNPTDAAFKYNINGVTLNLTENVGFAIKIAANGSNDVAALADGFQVKVTIGNGIVHYYDAFVYVDETKSEVAVIVDGVPAGFFDQDYTFTVVDANGNAVSATYTYSVNAWIVNEYQFGNGSVKMYLVRALYRMGLMAEEYIHG